VFAESMRNNNTVFPLLSHRKY